MRFLTCPPPPKQVHFGSPRERAEREMGEALELERQLAELTDPRELRRDADRLYNPETLDKLEVADGHPQPSWR